MAKIVHHDCRATAKNWGGSQTTVIPGDVEAESPLAAVMPGVSGASPGSVPLGTVVGTALFTGCGLVAAFRQQAWEFPVIHAFNAVAGRSAHIRTEVRSPFNATCACTGPAGSTLSEKRARQTALAAPASRPPPSREISNCAIAVP